MPKPIRVMIEVERIAFGDVFVSLDAMKGVVSITPLGDGPKGARQNGAGPKGSKGMKHGGAQSAPCLVLGALIETPGLGRVQLREVMTGNGKSANSLPDTLAKLKTAGEIRASGTGRDVTYKVTTAGKKRFETACQIQPPEGVA
jgi:hypothetical protein